MSLIHAWIPEDCPVVLHRQKKGKDGQIVNKSVKRRSVQSPDGGVMHSKRAYFSNG